MIRVPNNIVAIIPLFDSDFWNKDSKIIRPASTKERCDQGIVKYKGRDVPSEIKVGDHVFFSGYSGSLFELEDEGKLILIPVDFVVARLDDIPIVEVPGLYFRDKDGEYFQATYEMAMTLVRDGISMAPYFKKIDVKSEKPTTEELAVGGTWQKPK